MNDEGEVLLRGLEFQGHQCGASVAGVRAGLAAPRALAVKRCGGRELHAFVELGEDRADLCFGDGVQFATGCTVDLVWSAPEADVLTLGEMLKFERDRLPEITGFVPCTVCRELTACACLRVVGDRLVCIPCTGYEH